jgi:hypothetical protein
MDGFSEKKENPLFFDGKSPLEGRKVGTHIAIIIDSMLM